MKKVILLSALLLLLSLILAAKPKKEKCTSYHDALYCIEIDGKVHIPKEDQQKSYKIELLCINTIIDSGEVVDNELFLLKIKKNSWYTIRITKSGYFPLLISIDTRLPEYNTEKHTFHFTTDLIKEDFAIIKDRDAIDFPIALINYDKGKDDFSPVEEYSRNMRHALFNSPQPKLHPVKHIAGTAGRKT